MTLSGLCQSFPEWTTCHSLPHAKRVNQRCGRFLWVVILLTALGGAVYETYILTIEYLEYNVRTSVNLEYRTEVPFPAVTICNGNPIRYEAVVASGDNSAQWFLHILGNSSVPVSGRRRREAERRHTKRIKKRDLRSAQKTPLVMSLRELLMRSDVTHTQDSGFSRRLKRAAINYNDSATWWTNKENGLQMSALTELNDEARRLMQTFSAMGVQQRYEVGHHIETMLVDCTFAGKPCSPSNFTWIFDSVQGNCYTINSASLNTVEDISRPGPDHGLQMLLYVEQDQYIPHLSQYPAIKVFVHAPDTVPFPGGHGFVATPGHATSAALRRTDVSRLPAPFTDCREKDTEHSSDVYEEDWPSSYDAEICYKQCLQQHLKRRCGCFDALLPYHLHSLSSSACAVQNRVQYECQLDTEVMFQNGRLDCDCAPACDESIFVPTISSASWPIGNYRTTLINSLVAENIPGLSAALGADPNAIDSELVLLEVFYESMAVETITQYEAYSIHHFLCDLGGMFALMMGFSFITLLEYLELVIRSFGECIVAKHKKRKKKTTTGVQAFHPSYGDRVKDQLEIIRHAEEIDKNDDGPPSPPSPPRRRAKTAKAGRYQDESRTPNPPKQAPPPQKRAKTALSDLSDSDSDSEMESPARSRKQSRASKTPAPPERTKTTDTQKPKRKKSKSRSKSRATKE